jgi:hypothetical protein
MISDREKNVPGSSSSKVVLYLSVAGNCKGVYRICMDIVKCTFTP